ncbi:MAG: hypothetical protein OEV49_11190 [candidate division Zixibacteria bacterium]|nr:hypothetical protein [candidate division Zixibacteria bacterium]MDH3938659.1 hypothetical protein [candidate division Zixibacteria bacterium]MDH4034314.1 hypothetical protein [candidate division Zixibacteria bacterium]
MRTIYQKTIPHTNSEMAIRAFSLIFALSLMFVWGCEKDTGTGSGPIDFSYDEEWPANLDAILTDTFADSTDDQVGLPTWQDGPPYSEPVPFPSVDVTQIILGVDNGFLYMRVDFAGVIPSETVVIDSSGEIEHQNVTNQGMNIALNSDNDLDTGANGEGVWGVDIFFAVGFTYGQHSMVYANWDFSNHDVHLHNQQLYGEAGLGGQGYDHVVVRYKISGLGSYFPLGTTIEFGSWSEAESYNDDGSLKYHHFAFDPFTAVTWTIPSQ